MREMIFSYSCRSPILRSVLTSTISNGLPASFLIDKTGKVVQRYQGRMPAEAWDKIAELL